VFTAVCMVYDSTRNRVAGYGHLEYRNKIRSNRPGNRRRRHRQSTDAVCPSGCRRLCMSQWHWLLVLSSATAFISCRLDYCNSLFTAYLMDRLMIRHPGPCRMLLHVAYTIASESDARRHHHNHAGATPAALASDLETGGLEDSHLGLL